MILGVATPFCKQKLSAVSHCWISRGVGTLLGLGTLLRWQNLPGPSSCQLWLQIRPCWNQLLVWRCQKGFDIPGGYGLVYSRFSFNKGLAFPGLNARLISLLYVIIGVVGTFSIGRCVFSLISFPSCYIKNILDYLFRIWFLQGWSGAGANSRSGCMWSETAAACLGLTVASSLLRTISPPFPIFGKTTHSNETWRKNQPSHPADWPVLVFFGFLTRVNESACPQWSDGTGKAPGLSVPIDASLLLYFQRA